SNLAAAYGIAVTGNMLVTTVLLYIVMTRIWNWRVSRALPFILGFLVIDIMFFSANIIKVHEGGWASIGIAVVLVLIM
ncbi:KUP/HAK/KT family potassium transporter, partial [Burkholderia sp. SIMBA_024]